MSTYAAIDVGSNSIRLLIAEAGAASGSRALHVDREVVRLGKGVFRDGRLAAGATEQALEVLRRMAAAVRSYRVSALRAVGTSALRDADNRVQFVEAASAVLGVPLDVIGGTEEARLVHAGVTAEWPHAGERLVIVDLGGGSAQVIVSDGGRLESSVSLPLGAVRLTERFISSDPPSAHEISALRRHVRDQLGVVGAPDVRDGAHRLVATSGTARAVVSAVNRVGKSRRDRADRLSADEQQTAQLFVALAARTSAERADLPGVGRRRADVIVAGTVVLQELMTVLRAPVLTYSSAGVRDGIVAELASQDQAEDVALPFLAGRIAHAC